jgi:hypothetical protein
MFLNTDNNFDYRDNSLNPVFNNQEVKENKIEVINSLYEGSKARISREIEILKRDYEKIDARGIPYALLAIIAQCSAVAIGVICASVNPLGLIPAFLLLGVSAKFGCMSYEAFKETYVKSTKLSDKYMEKERAEQGYSQFLEYERIAETTIAEST